MLSIDASPGSYLPATADDTDTSDDEDEVTDPAAMLLMLQKLDSVEVMLNNPPQPVQITQCSKCDFRGTRETVSLHEIDHLTKMRGETVVVRREAPVKKQPPAGLLECQFCPFRCVNTKNLHAHERKHLKE